MAVLAGAERPTRASCARSLRGSASRLGALPGVDSGADLEGLYALAACFVLPSFEEGFGLPILEAMGRGVPVACSNVSSLPEVAGDAAELFDPRAPGDIARPIGRLLADPELRAELVRRGQERAAAFTWEGGPRTLASYRRAVGPLMSGPLRVAINALFYEPGAGGTETYLRGLVPALRGRAGRSRGLRIA